MEPSQIRLTLEPRTNRTNNYHRVKFSGLIGHLPEFIYLYINIVNGLAKVVFKHLTTWANDTFSPPSRDLIKSF